MIVAFLFVSLPGRIGPNDIPIDHNDGDIPIGARSVSDTKEKLRSPTNEDYQSSSICNSASTYSFFQSIADMGLPTENIVLNELLEKVEKLQRAVDKVSGKLRVPVMSCKDKSLLATGLG